VATSVQVTFDCAEPDALARFWCSVLGYQLQQPPEGFASWDDWLRQQGIPPQRWGYAAAAVDPELRGPRLYFQRVPEGKTAKNRVHLDVNVGRDNVPAAIERLVGLGATVLTPPHVSDLDELCAVLADPEGNEFCLQ
jgi:uncharacterized glyoxalase superfamily protein PhnB